MIRQAAGRIKTATKSLSKSEYDALDLLRSDHMKVEAMLIQLRLAKDASHRKKLFRSLRSDLEKHMRIEESIFYPACSGISKIHDLVHHSFDEHQEVKGLLKEMGSSDFSGSRFPKMVTQLTKMLLDHVSEEENTMFAGVSKYMEKREFNRLSRDMLEAHAGDARNLRAAA